MGRKGAHRGEARRSCMSALVGRRKCLFCCDVTPSQFEDGPSVNPRPSIKRRGWGQRLPEWGCREAQGFYGRQQAYAVRSRSHWPGGVRRGARVADWAGLENRCRGNSTEGSNPSLSAPGDVHRSRCERPLFRLALFHLVSAPGQKWLLSLHRTYYTGSAAFGPWRASC